MKQPKRIIEIAGDPLHKLVQTLRADSDSLDALPATDADLARVVKRLTGKTVGPVVRTQTIVCLGCHHQWANHPMAMMLPCPNCGTYDRSKN